VSGIIELYVLVCDVRHEVTEGCTVTRKQSFGERKLYLLLYKILLILILKIVEYEAFNFAKNFF
jgi:hypothetical protein